MIRRCIEKQTMLWLFILFDEIYNGLAGDADEAQGDIYEEFAYIRRVWDRMRRLLVRI